VLATDARQRRKALLRQRFVLNLLRVAQERFIASPAILPLPDILNAAIESTESAFGCGFRTARCPRGNRSGEYSEAVIQELHPIIATYRSLLIGWRNARQRHATEQPGGTERESRD